MLSRVVLVTIVIIQVVCAFFFVADILSSVIGLRAHPIDWQLRELLEIGAAFGLVLGVIMGSIALSHAGKRVRKAEEKLRFASIAFIELLHEKFDSWGLTPAERDVALFAIKGLSLMEIATARNTSEGTVKAQTNAIYRKANVTGRTQLLSLFIDDLMDNALPVVAQVAAVRNGQ